MGPALCALLLAAAPSHAGDPLTTTPTDAGSDPTAAWDGCGAPTKTWYDACDTARAAPIDVAASSTGDCPAGATAFAVSGAVKGALCELKSSGGYELQVGRSGVKGVPNATTCASVAWADGSGWCRLPRSTACPPSLCRNPHPAPPPSPSPTPTPNPTPSPPPPPPSPAKTPTVLAFYMGDVGAPSYWIDYDWSILSHIVMYG